MTAQLTEKIYTYIWPKDSMRYATIKFSVADGKFSFDRCDFKCICKIYDVDDWAFLRDLAEEIVQLTKEGKEVSK